MFRALKMDSSRIPDKGFRLYGACYRVWYCEVAIYHNLSLMGQKLC